MFFDFIQKLNKISSANSLQTLTWEKIWPLLLVLITFTGIHISTQETALVHFSILIFLLCKISKKSDVQFTWNPWSFRSVSGSSRFWLKNTQSCFIINGLLISSYELDNLWESLLQMEWCDVTGEVTLINKVNIYLLRTY